jgi:hypothetical protein
LGMEGYAKAVESIVLPQPEKWRGIM